MTTKWRKHKGGVPHGRKNNPSGNTDLIKRESRSHYTRTGRPKVAFLTFEGAKARADAIGACV